MLLRMSTMFLRTLREDPAEAEVPSHRLLLRAGFIRRAAPGGYTWLPLGKLVLDRVVDDRPRGDGRDRRPGGAPSRRCCRASRTRSAAAGPSTATTSSGCDDRRGADYLLAPTHEEMFTLLVQDVTSSYRDFPLILFQVQTQVPGRGAAARRAAARPRVPDEGRVLVRPDRRRPARRPTARMRAAYQRIFDRLGLDVHDRRRDVRRDGRFGVGGVPGPRRVGRGHVRRLRRLRVRGEHRGRDHAGAAPRDRATGPPLAVHDTPDTPTIASLVDLANARALGGRTDWTAADTLKNVVVTSPAPGGEDASCW